MGEIRFYIQSAQEPALPPPKILGAKWRSARDTIGIVAVDAGNGRWEAFMGVAKSNDQVADAAYIANYGARMSKQEALAFFHEFDPRLFTY